MRMREYSEKLKIEKLYPIEGIELIMCKVPVKCIIIYYIYF